MDVNRIGYGAMRLTGQPGNFGPYPDWEDGVALLRRAYALGVRFFDSAYAYGPGWADRILGEALGDSDAVIATKDAVLFATQPPSLGNLRLVFGKWMSGNADRYVTAIVVLAIVLGVVLAASARSRSRNV